MLNKIKKSNGEVHLVIVVAFAAAIILLGVIIVPVIKGKMDEQAVKLDEQIESTAVRLAKEENPIIGSGTHYVVYDSANKRFVDVKQALSVEPYGNSTEHTGMVIYIRIKSREDVSAIWDLPQNEHSYD